MICQRCGHCCVSMPVVIPSGNGMEGLWKPGGVVCPHLSFEGRVASCAVHHLPQYEGSPCHIYGNSDYDADFLPKRGLPCLVGRMLLNSGRDVCKGAARVDLASLEGVRVWF
jgi:hypothetical protein